MESSGNQNGLGELAYFQSKDNAETLADITNYVKAIVVLTQDEYDALAEVSATTLYLIEEE